jgi:hypothetical protein
MYNRTAFPTPLQHRSREAVEFSSEYILLGVLHHLLEGQCNPDLRLLGCAVLVPRCEGGRTRRPCRHVCEGLREACLPAFDAIDMAWPYFLDCARYFARKEDGCYDPLEQLRGKASQCCSLWTCLSPGRRWAQTWWLSRLGPQPQLPPESCSALAVHWGWGGQVCPQQACLAMLTLKDGAGSGAGAASSRRLSGFQEV